jgi:hypothetical protein
MVQYQCCGTVRVMLDLSGLSPIRGQEDVTGAASFRVTGGMIPDGDGLRRLVLLCALIDPVNAFELHSSPELCLFYCHCNMF